MRIAKSREQYKRLAHPGNPLDARDELSELVENQHFILKQLLDTEEDIAQDAGAIKAEADSKETVPNNPFTSLIDNGEKAALLKIVEIMKKDLDQGSFEAPEHEEDIYRRLPVKEYFSLLSGIARISVLLGAKK